MKKIQIKWKSILRIEKTRKLILINIWSKEVKKLIEKYKKMNKKHKMLIPKIDTIHPNLRNSTLKDYYFIMKTKYKFILKKWLEILKRNAQKESINTNNNIQQKSDMKIGGD